MGIDGAQVTEIVVTPEGVEDLLAAESYPLIYGKVNKEFVFFGTEVNAFAIAGYHTCHLVNDKTVKVFYAAAAAFRLLTEKKLIRAINTMGLKGFVM